MRALIVILALASWGCQKTTPEAPEPAPQTSGAIKAPATRASDAAKAPPAAPKADPVTGAAELVPGPEAHGSLLTEAKTYFLAGKLDEAEPYFAQLAGMSPVSSEVVTATIALGDIYAQTNRAQVAMKLYEDLLARVPNIPMVYLVVGRAYAGQEAFGQAIGAYQKALSYQPGFVFLHKEIGQMQAQLGKPEDAAETLLKYERAIYQLAKDLEAHGKTPLEERINIIDVFSMVEDDRVTQSLVLVLTQDPAGDARQAAAKVLGEVLAVSAREPLKKASMLDSEEEVRQAAKAALEAMKGIASPGVGDSPAPRRVDSPAKLPE